MGIDYSRQMGRKIATKGSRKSVIRVMDIVYMESSGNLITIYLKDGATDYDIKPLHEFESELFDYGFFRIHYHTLVNGRYVTGTDAGERVVMLKEKRLKISRRRLKAFNLWISSNPVTG
ncbi:MAG: LytTR family transcriptional regulator [Bacteroidales bacterium]|jgi:DNA-binding LytR/AlgR family response regulator|nr:LytTR family transcriptional regulator [Bacteroidales bacterium]